MCSTAVLVGILSAMFDPVRLREKVPLVLRCAEESTRS